MLETLTSDKSPDLEIELLAQPWPQDLQNAPYAGVYVNGDRFAGFTRNWNIFFYNPRIKRFVTLSNPGEQLHPVYSNELIRNMSMYTYDLTEFDVAYGKYESQKTDFCNVFDSIPDHCLIFVVSSHYCYSIPDEFKTRLVNMGVPLSDLTVTSGHRSQIMIGYKNSPPNSALVSQLNNAIENDVTSCKVTFRI